MNDDCSKWSLLSDREALGEVLALDEQSYLRRHAASCEACGAEQATWSELESLLDSDDATGQQEPRRVSTVGRPRVNNRFGGRRWLHYTGMIAATAVVLFMVLRNTAKPPEARPQVATNRGAPALVQGAKVADVAVRVVRAFELDIDGTAASEGAEVPLGAELRVRKGIACLAVAGGVRACILPGSVVRVSELAPERRRLELVAGKIVAELEPQPRGTSFGIVTRDGIAIAIGTAYSVEVRADGSGSLTRVSHGTVLVRSRTGSERRVSANFAARMGGEVVRLSGAESEHEARLLADTRGPQPALVHTATVHDQAPRRQGPAARAVEGAPRAMDVRPSPARLLANARAHRARGDAQNARASYELLFRLHERSAEARAARVAYGELELAGGSAERALAEFERYLREGGPLIQEAWFGRVRALRKLGRVPEAQRATREFSALFPDSPLARSLNADVQP